MSIHHTIESRLENAVSGILSTHLSAASALPIHVGFDNVSIIAPYIAIICDQSIPYIHGCDWTGNYTCNMMIQVNTHYKDNTRYEHEQYFGEVRDVLYRTDLKEMMNSTGQNLGVMKIDPGNCTRSTNIDQRQSIMNISVFTMTVSA